MSIKIAAWNIEGRLSGDVSVGRGTTAHILKSIKELDADIIVLPEAFMDAPAEGVLKQLDEFGYETHSISYEDRDREKNDYFHGVMHMCILSRLPISDVAYIRPSNIRNLITCSVKDAASGQKLRIVAIHLEDRSEALRTCQVDELAEYINDSDDPVVVLGDFNAMWHKGRALLVSSWLTRYIARHLSHEALRGVILRAIDMATGTSLNLLVQKTRLLEVDLSHRPTATPKRYGALWMPSIRLIQIDHIFISPEIIAGNFTVGKDGGSDHRAISATLSLW